MAHTITVPINENGIIFDLKMNTVVAEAIAPTPFQVEDVYIYSHGWSTDAYQALDSYNQFSVELAKGILVADGAVPSPFLNGPRNSLGIGIHWPSEITEDPTSPLNYAQLFTFYTMEHRADAVGKNAVYSMLRLILSNRAGVALPIRLFLLGHSFGSKVVCAALNDLQIDIAGGTIPTPAGLQFRIVLLQAATDNDNLEPGDIYGQVCNMNNLRLLLTKSGADRALNEWYPAAGKIANLFHQPPPALGAVGPTVATAAAFGQAINFDVKAGFSAADAARAVAGGIAGASPSRLFVADLTTLHQQRAAAGLYNGGFSGSHSDIYFTEVYNLIMGFLFS